MCADPPGEATTAAVAPSMPRTVAPVWFFFSLAAMLALHFGWPGPRWNLGASRWWGLPLAIVGFALVVVGAGRFRSATTLRPYEASSELVTDGLHAVSRNPMYLGLFVSLVGAFVMLGSTTPGLMVPLFYLWLRYRYVAYEEYAMEAAFGDAYRDYRGRVRRWL